MPSQLGSSPGENERCLKLPASYCWYHNWIYSFFHNPNHQASCKVALKGVTCYSFCHNHGSVENERYVTIWRTLFHWSMIIYRRMGTVRTYSQTCCNEPMLWVILWSNKHWNQVSWVLSTSEIFPLTLLFKGYCSAVDHDSVVDLAKQGMSFCWMCDSAFILATVDGSEIPNNHLRCLKPVNNRINLTTKLNWLDGFLSHQLYQRILLVDHHFLLQKTRFPWRGPITGWASKWHVALVHQQLLLSQHLERNRKTASSCQKRCNINMIIYKQRRQHKQQMRRNSNAKRLGW